MSVCEINKKIVTEEKYFSRNVSDLNHVIVIEINT